MMNSVTRQKRPTSWSQSQRSQGLGDLAIWGDSPPRIVPVMERIRRTPFLARTDHLRTKPMFPMGPTRSDTSTRRVNDWDESSIANPLFMRGLTLLGGVKVSYHAPSDIIPAWDRLKICLIQELSNNDTGSIRTQDAKGHGLCQLHR